jgi:ATP-dependent RNA helicase DDX35
MGMKAKVGEIVGYGVRFDYKCSSLTKIKYYTDGVLLREMMSDPLLSKYSVVIVDEAHQRTLHSDVILGLLKKVQRKRPDLRIIITSATLDALTMKNFFETNIQADYGKDTAVILSIQGRQHSVDVLYLEEPCRNYLKKTLETIFAIHESEDCGDILVFLPGSEEIESLNRMFTEELDRFNANSLHQEDSRKRKAGDENNRSGDRSVNNLYLLPLYSTLPHFQQMKVFENTPYHMRKVVVATNIAESSITIDNIRFVIDSGFMKLNYFDVRSGIDSLITCEITKSAAAQRAGRAGRTQSGKCFRLMTEVSYQQLGQYPLVEIQRIDISWILLQLKSLGIHDVLHFDYLTAPTSQSMIYALELLYNLNAITEKGEITAIGSQMAEMPIEPKLAKVLISSLDFGCSEEILSVVSMLSVEYPFIQLKHTAANPNSSAYERQIKLEKDIESFSVKGSDHLTLLKIYNDFTQNNYSQSWCDSSSLLYKILYKAKDIRSNLYTMLKKFVLHRQQSGSNSGIKMIASCGDDDKAIRKCLVAGFFPNVAKLSPRGDYQLLRGGKSVSPHPFSVMSRMGTYPEYVLFNDVVYNNHSGGPDNRNTAAINTMNNYDANTSSGSSRKNIVYMREISKIDPFWLYDVASHYYDLTM